MRMARALALDFPNGEAGIATRGKKAQIDFDKVRARDAE
jgi:hypothetical protein